MLMTGNNFLKALAMGLFVQLVMGKNTTLFYTSAATHLEDTFTTVVNGSHVAMVLDSKDEMGRDGNSTQEIDTTLTPLTKMNSGDGSKEELLGTMNVNAENTCPDMGITQLARSVVKCKCQGNEILLQNGTCQPYDGIVVPVQHDWIYTREETIDNRKVIIKDVACDPTVYIQRTFTRRDFQLRDRGDLVLLEDAGTLQGQRINNYCITHHLDNHNELTWTLKACVPIPSVPRCCPFGCAMKDGECREAKTPHFLKPPINAKPFGHPIEWENITNYYSPITCRTMPVKTIPIGYKESNLVSLANGLRNGWVPGVTGRRRVYHKCPEYCVDGIEDYDGSIEYFTSFCYKDPIEAHKEACGKDVCIQKCCKDGEIMDQNKYGCIPDTKALYNPVTITNLSHYNTVVGYPLCEPVEKLEEKFDINQNGILITEDKLFQPENYCLDIFLDNGVGELSALVCKPEPNTWIIVRKILFKNCNAISILSLIILIVLHLTYPQLLNKGVIHVIFYAISLFIAYAASFTVHTLHDHFSLSFCVTIASIMQFGFLATFFWLNVMCFEIWRKIMTFENALLPKFYPKWYYVLYGWGIPLCICVVTKIMQDFAPSNVPGLIKPYFGISRCWFREDIALFLYFYGPMTLLMISNALFLVMSHYKLISRRCATKIDGVTKDSESTTIQNMRKKNQWVLIFFTIVTTFWMTELLSWKIPPVELWAFSDTVNSLQGLLLLLFTIKHRQLCEGSRKLSQNHSQIFNSKGISMLQKPLSKSLTLNVEQSVFTIIPEQKYNLQENHGHVAQKNGGP